MQNIKFSTKVKAINPETKVEEHKELLCDINYPDVATMIESGSMDSALLDKVIHAHLRAHLYTTIREAGESVELEEVAVEDIIEMIADSVAPKARKSGGIPAEDWVKIAELFNTFAEKAGLPAKIAKVYMNAIKTKMAMKSMLPALQNQFEQVLSGFDSVVSDKNPLKEYVSLLPGKAAKFVEKRDAEEESLASWSFDAG